MLLGAQGGRGREGRVGLGVVLRRPLRGRFLWPFDVAALGIRYFWTDLALRCGAPRRKPALMVLIREVIGGLHRLWCMKFIEFALVVWWYENNASSGGGTKGGCGARPLQGPGCDGVGSDTTKLDLGVVHSPISLWRMGSLQRLLARSLYPVRIMFPLKLTQHFSPSKITLHPALQRMCMPSKDAIFISGTICPINLCGRLGMSTSHMCVDTI
jgi:hypothetical protein